MAAGRYPGHAYYGYAYYGYTCCGYAYCGYACYGYAYQVRMPQGGDDKYLAKITERQRSSRVFAGPGENTHIHSAAFLVKHYAGDVVYDVRGMLEKNADRLSRNLYMLLTAATNPRTAAIFPERDERTAGKVSTLTVRVRVRLRVRV